MGSHQWWEPIKGGHIQSYPVGWCRVASYVDVLPYRRVDAGEFAIRINTAAALAAAGVPTTQATADLAARFGVSTRQARRYLARAQTTGTVTVPETTIVFTVRLPTSMVTTVRTRAAETGTTISALVCQALADHLNRDRRQDQPR